MRRHPWRPWWRLQLLRTCHRRTWRILRRPTPPPHWSPVWWELPLQRETGRRDVHSERFPWERRQSAVCMEFLPEHGGKSTFVRNKQHPPSHIWPDWNILLYTQGFNHRTSFIIRAVQKPADRRLKLGDLWDVREVIKTFYGVQERFDFTAAGLSTVRPTLRLCNSSDSTLINLKNSSSRVLALADKQIKTNFHAQLHFMRFAL